MVTSTLPLAIFDFTSAVIWLSGTACVVEAASDVAAAGAGEEPGDELSATDGAATDGVGNDGAEDGSLLLSLLLFGASLVFVLSPVVVALLLLVVSAEATRVPEELSLLRDLATRRSELSADDLALADFD